MPPPDKASSRSQYWRCRSETLELGPSPVVMGILNVTPDSFSDGGTYLDAQQAIEHGLEMISEGAVILDVGGESTRPGAEPVSIQEELDRIGPVLEGLRASPGVLLSVDTTKAEVAQASLAAGAHIINDVSAMTADPAMPKVAADSRAGVVLMHMQGEPRTMQESPKYVDVVAEVRSYLLDRRDTMVRAGVAPDAVCLDPGIGFGKTVEHNLALLRATHELAHLGHPLLVGASRKSFLGALTNREVGDRLSGSLGVAAYCAQRGAHILRVHDVKESCDVLRLMDMLGREELD